jgi:hypothetical protein
MHVFSSKYINFARVKFVKTSQNNNFDPPLPKMLICCTGKIANFPILGFEWFLKSYRVQ